MRISKFATNRFGVSGGRRRKEKFPNQKRTYRRPKL